MQAFGKVRAAGMDSESLRRMVLHVATHPSLLLLVGGVLHEGAATCF
jgi:hypothetical protein